MADTIRDSARRFDQQSPRALLSTSRIVFLVVAAAAPLAAMVGNLPIALGRGNGAGAPGAFLFATLTLICFSIGYAAMGRRIVNTGAFYTYVAQGLGKAAGVGAAFVAVIAYLTFTVGLAAAFGYFLDLVLTSAGVKGPWITYVALGVGLTAVLGYRSVDLSSKVLGVLMAAEIAVLGLFDFSVLAAKGFGGLPLISFTPHAVFAPGFAIALMFAYTCFTGFESAALYGEEAQEPTRSIPRATFVSVLLIGGFYLATAWITIGAIGPDQAQSMARSEGGQLMFELLGRFSSPVLAELMGVLVCTSILASYLAIHNAATRYLFALSREKLLPPALGRFHAKRYAPSNASAAVTGITVVVVSALALAGADPYKAAIPALIGLATFGIIVLQALAALSIVAYFRARKSDDLWRTLVAPALGAAGLVLATGLVAWNFGLLTTSGSTLVKALPLIYLVGGGLGSAFALWLRKQRPQVYADLAAADLRADSERVPRAPVVYDGRYCIVGAGPCGLLAARAFKLAGIPYDQFERHEGVGGIWDIDNPGSSMYEAAHFISSKYTSGFFGLPMPEAYPDYPDYRQLLAYIRDFADAYGLTSGVTFNTGVARAEPLGKDAEGGWRVTLSSGEVRTYKGIVCATGVTWHPNLPHYPGLEDFKGEARHTVSFRKASEFQGRRVLIIGAGNSGVDIACEAARNAEAAFISVRRGYRFVPKHIFGVPTDIFMSGLVKPPKGVVLPDDPSEMMDALVGDLTRYGLPKPDHKLLESHPIMNSQILHHLAHGDLKAKPAIQRFTPTGAVFADGTEEAFDLVLFATGYDYKIPFLDEALFTWKQGHPELYLNIFHRTLKGLSVVGFVEFASAGYQRFDEMAQMTAMDAYIEQSGQGLADWRRMKAEDRPNLRGSTRYIDSPRHANYVDVAVYRRLLSDIRARFGWPDPDDQLYAPLKRSAGPPSPSGVHTPDQNRSRLRQPA
jgi:cation diffusion facilitator CzcD-associated flavoprotein CzcO/amino acid transporter